MDTTRVSSSSAVEGCDKPVDASLFNELALIDLTKYKLVRFGNQSKGVYYMVKKSVRVENTMSRKDRLSLKTKSIVG